MEIWFSLFRNRELYDGDYLWRHGFDNWLPAAQISELRDLVQNGGQVETNTPMQNAAPLNFEDAPITDKASTQPNDEAVRGLAPVGQHDAGLVHADVMNTQLNEVPEPYIDQDTG